jgi:hypothetical protein
MRARENRAEGEIRSFRYDGLPAAVPRAICSHKGERQSSWRSAEERVGAQVRKGCMWKCFFAVNDSTRPHARSVNSGDPSERYWASDRM